MKFKKGDNGLLLQLDTSIPFIISQVYISKRCYKKFAESRRIPTILTDPDRYRHSEHIERDPADPDRYQLQAKVFYYFHKILICTYAVQYAKNNANKSIKICFSNICNLG